MDTDDVAPSTINLGLEFVPRYDKTPALAHIYVKSYRRGRRHLLVSSDCKTLAALEGEVACLKAELDRILASARSLPWS